MVQFTKYFLLFSQLPSVIDGGLHKEKLLWTVVDLRTWPMIFNGKKLSFNFFIFSPSYRSVLMEYILLNGQKNIFVHANYSKSRKWYNLCWNNFFSGSALDSNLGHPRKSTVLSNYCLKSQDNWMKFCPNIHNGLTDHSQ